MALFGSDMVQVRTPDGRQLTLPSQLAAQFPGLQVQPPVQNLGPSLGGAAPGPPQHPAAELPPPVTPPPGPVTTPEQSPPGPPNAMPQGPVTTPAQATDPGPPNTPKPPSSAELAAQGPAAYQAEVGALGQKQAAVKQAAQVDADAATAAGNAMAARDAETQRILNERKQIADDNASKLNARMAEYDREAKAIAATKIDREADHPVLASIGVMLGAIGTAMANRQSQLSAAYAGRAAGPMQDNPAMAAFYAGIDRKVAAQMQDLDRRRQGLAVQKGAIDMQREIGADKLAQIDQYKLGYLTQAQQQIETLKTKSSSAQTKAAAEIAQADIEQKKGELLGAAAQREHANIQAEQARKDQLTMHAQSVGVQLRGQNLEQGRWVQEFAERKREFDKKEENDLRVAMLAHPGKAAAAAQAAQKDNEERALSDPSSGEWLVQPDGAKLRQEAAGHDKTAEQMRAAAAQEQDPNRRAMLQTRADAEAQKASELRVDVAQNHVWKVGKEERGKLSDQISTAQTVAGLADQLKTLRDKYGAEITSGDAKAQMQSISTQLLMHLKNAWELGVLSGSDADYIETATGGDPSKLKAADVTRLFGSVDTAPRLDALVRGVEDSVRNKMRGKGFKGDWKVLRDTTAPAEQDLAKTIGSSTPYERSQAQEKGALGSTVDTVRGAGRTALGVLSDVATTGNADPNALADFSKSRERVVGERQAAVENQNASSKISGLNKEQGDYVDASIKAYLKGATSDNKTLRDAADKAKDALTRLATNADRPSLSGAVLDALNDRAPGLAKEISAAVPDTLKESRQQLQQTGISIAPVGILRSNALQGDTASIAELGRRAVSGDKDAARAVQDIINARKVR